MISGVWVPNTPCWAPDQERAFVEARVVSVKDGQATLSILSPGGDSVIGERTASTAELMPRTPDQRCVAEMDDLQELHVASVLNNVDLLFGRPQCSDPGQGPSTIYSSVGPVLIAMNPFANLPIYGDAWVEAYHRAGVDERASRALGPHCFRTVEEAYCRLRHSRHQSVVICGESGAGKTVTNRKMLEYLCQVARRRSLKESRAPCGTMPPTGTMMPTGTMRGMPPPTASLMSIPTASFVGTLPAGPVGADPRQITEGNVLLESFGNAKTTRNDNSSRFGKYTKLSFDMNPADGQFVICGCQIDHYLLERSRVCSQPKGERNYHIFYQLLRSGEGSKYSLKGGPEDYRYCRDGAAIQGFDDASDFRDVCSGMAQAGFDDATIESVFESVAAVLLLGNVEFAGSGDDSKVEEGSKAVLAQACALLGVEPDALSNALCSSLMKVPGGKTIRKALGVDQARAQCDTVAKTIYSRLFDDIVGFISSKMRKKARRSEGLERHNSNMTDEGHTIGLLDIFGFEDMATNGFEQMFINLTNERIQHLFNSIMFKREVEAYRKEGIASVFNPGMDNLECVRLFTNMSNPPGIVKLLSESALMRTGRDGAAFVSVLNSSFAQHPSFEVCGPQDAQRVAKAKGLKGGSRGTLALDYRECFQIRHYAGLVMYTVQDWVPKSMDALLPHLTEVMSVSTKPKMKDLFEKQEEGGQKTIGEKFCAQLEVLADTLEQGDTLFVRCIKSNLKMVPGLVDRPFVLEQLINGGVIAALEMRHRGLPERMDYETFCDEFDLLERAANAKKDFKTRCELLMIEIFGQEAEQDTQFAFGTTKVFMKSHINAFMRAVMSLRTRNMVKRVQRRWRRFMGTQAIKTVTAAWEQLDATSTRAKSRGVQDLPGVSKALQEAESKIGPMMQALEELRAKHGNDSYKIGASLPVEKLGSLHHAAEAAEALVTRVLERKDESDALFGARFGTAMNKLSKFGDRIQALEDECVEVADEVEEVERESFMKSCKAARARLEELRTKEVPALKALGPAGVDLEAESELKGIEVCPKLVELMAEAETLVVAAEQQGYDILRVRRAFQKAVQEGQGKHDDAQTKLEALQETARQCVAEGLDGIVEKINDAWQKEVGTQELLLAAKDADAYAAAVEAFVAAVREAEDAVEKGREELAKREAEKEERRELQQTLDRLQQKLAEHLEVLRRSLQVRLQGQQGGGGTELFRTIEELGQEGAKLRGSSSAALSDWRPQVEEFTRKAKAAMSDVDGAVSKVYKARQEEFNKRVSVFQSSPSPHKIDAEDPEEFIRLRGLSAHEDDMLEIARLMKRLKDGGMPRSSAKQCVDHFFKCAYGTPAGMSSFTPEARQLNFGQGAQ